MAGLHTLTRATPRKAKRVGRGGKRGKTAGRGTKGQNARAGRKKRPELRDIIKKLPKRRGYGKNRARTVNPLRPRPLPVSLARIAEVFPAGQITTAMIVEKKLVAARPGAITRVKILGDASVSKKFSIKGCLVSASARSAIEKAGGTIA